MFVGIQVADRVWKYAVRNWRNEGDHRVSLERHFTGSYKHARAFDDSTAFDLVRELLALKIDAKAISPSGHFQELPDTATLSKQVPPAFPTDDGWRRTPVIQKTMAGYVVAFAIVLDGEPIAGKFTGRSEREVFEKLIDTSTPFGVAFVSSLPRPSEAEISQAQALYNSQLPPAPKVYSAEEIASYEVTRQEISALTAAEYRNRWYNDPRFQPALERLENRERLAEEAFRRKQRAEDAVAAKKAAELALEQSRRR